ncbi:DUF536 domain-containing protein [Enterococcus faecium]
MTEKTIKELAEELGVSKTAINKKVSDENRKLWFSKIGNKFVINETGQKAIKSMFFNENENSNQQLVGEKTKTENRKPQKRQPSSRIRSPFSPRTTVKSKRYATTRKRRANKTNAKITRPPTTTHPASQPTNRETAGTTTVDLYGRIFGK